MPSVGSGACDAVGPTSCATGFAQNADGWGCAAIVPPAACTGATRAAIGSKSCAPIDDCTRAFPPAGATLVTDDASLATALTSAKAGDTIALEAGTYAGIEIPTDLNLVGRCAEKVTFQGTGDRGLFVTGQKKVSIESITVTGFTAAIVASWYSDVTATHVVARDVQMPFTAGGSTLHVVESVGETSNSTASSSAINAQGGATVLVESSDIRGFGNVLSSYEDGTSITLKRSVVRYDAAKEDTTLVMALGGSHTVIDESAFHWRAAPFAWVARALPGVSSLANQAGGILEIRNSDIAQTGAEMPDPLVKVDDTGSLTLDNTTILHQTPAAIMIHAAGSKLATSNSLIRSAAVTDQERVAIWALRGGAATLDGTAILDAQENALLSTSDGSTLVVNRSLVQHTLPGTQNADEDMGPAGIALVAAANGVASVTDSAFVGSENLAVLAGEGAQVQLARTVVDATGGSAVCGQDAVLTIDSSLVRKSDASAIVFMGGNAIVKNSHFVDNQVGVQLAEGDVVDATSDPTTADDDQVVMFGNVFDTTGTMITRGPFNPPTVSP